MTPADLSHRCVCMCVSVSSSHLQAFWRLSPPFRCTTPFGVHSSQPEIYQPGSHITWSTAGRLIFIWFCFPHLPRAVRRQHKSADPVQCSSCEHHFRLLSTPAGLSAQSTALSVIPTLMFLSCEPRPFATVQIIQINMTLEVPSETYHKSLFLRVRA